MAIVAHQVTYRGGSDGNVPAITDRRLYDFLLSNSTGVVEGLTPSPSSSGEYKFSAGWGFIQGCMFTVDNTLSVEMLATSSDTASRVIARLNVALSTIEFEEQLQPYPALVQEDILHNGSIYEVVMARFSLNSRNVSAATLEMPVLKGMDEYATELNTLRFQFDVAAAKLATIEQGAQVNTVTGVKGTKESSYRTGNVSLTAANVGAVPTTRKVNGKELSADITLTAANVGAVPTTRKVNGIALSSDIELTASDIHAVPYFLTNIYTGTLADNLEDVWAATDIGRPSLGMVERNASTNDRYLVMTYKVAESTGVLIAFDFKATSSKAKMRVFLRSGGTFTEYDFTSD